MVLSTQPVDGMIGYLGLSDWWLTSLTEEQRRTIRHTFNPLGGCDLENGKIEYSNETPLSFLTALAGWFAKDDVRSIAYRILDKAATYVPTASNPMDVHFFYQAQIEIYYRDRDTQEGLNRAIDACQRQIAYAPTAASAFKRPYPTQPLPTHKGYTQLAIIFESQEKYCEIINLCSAAKKDGWRGDWDKRIARCNKKLETRP
jgi:hypothetical protein